MKILGMTALFAGLCSVLMPSSIMAAEEEAFVFAYRATEPITKEFDDPKKAAAYDKALKTLGCKAKVESHDGHIDITFQQPRWTLVTLQSEELVHKWQDFLNDEGCETLHSEDPEHHEEHDDAHKHAHDKEMEIISFQTKDWVEKHFEKEGTGAEFVVVCKALGCEFKEDIHDGHADVSFRCAKPRTIECAGHEAAESRAEWLTKLGFAVKHDH
ncbi:MAG: hypothetical protein JNM43_14995 [Planctomycetaceae bacterium]|nr:hypothetical protein [Planctomycetaceae bacterium]